MSYTVSVAPAVEPITTTEAKNWLKVSSSADDDIIDMLIASERQLLEDRLNLKLISQTIVQKIDKFPPSSNPIYLEANPVSSVTSIFYKDAAGSTTEWTNTNWTLDYTSERARIYLNEGGSYPTPIAEPESVIITYVAGYANAASVPSKYKKLLYHLIAFAYDNRQNPIQSRITYLDKLISNQRLYYFE